MNLGAAQLGRLETAGPKQQDRAIAANQRALQANPETPNAHYHLGLIYKVRGELIRAAAFIQRALEVDPADQDARYWLDKLPAMTAAQEREAQNAALDVDDVESNDEILEEILGDIFEEITDEDDRDDDVQESSPRS